VRIAFTPDGTQALVTEKDTGSLAVLDARYGALRRRVDLGAAGVEGLAVDGEHSVIVANPLAGAVSRVDLESAKVTASCPLPGEPFEVAVSPDHRRAFVSLAGLSQIAELDLPSLEVRRRIAVGDHPRALALLPDGKTLVVAAFRGGEICLVDTEAGRETRRITLRGRNLRGLTVGPDGIVWVTGQIPAETRVTWVADDVWVNALFRVDPRAGAAAEGRLDEVGAAAPDPDGVVALGPNRIALTSTGSDQALLVSASASDGGYFTTRIERRMIAGAHPRGITLGPDGKQLWVANEVGGTLSVLDSADLAPRFTFRLGIPERPDPRLRGRYLFGNSGMTAGRQFTCGSCHPEGGTDGLVWEFVHVPDAIPARHTRSLRSGVAGTAPFRWSGRETDLKAFVQDEITGLMHGRTQSTEDLQALADFASDVPLPPNPNRAAGGFTPSGERGRELFLGKAGCGSCHSGPRFGGEGKRAWIGTTPEGQTLDVPHLTGAYDSAPYLHDGRAHTLEEIFGRWNAYHRHGNAHQLAPSELADVLEFVREL
jgi:DNA-binding beta-propeller fold protein YncE